MCRVRCAAAVVLIVFGACRGGGDGPAGPEPGSIAVSIATAGVATDPDGYAVSVDGGPGQAVAVSGTAVVPGVSEGRHTVSLGDLAANCRAAAGTNPQTVAVATGDTAEVAFAVTCGGPPAATTLPATGVTERSVVLNAAINPDGWSTRWSFEVGPTDTLGGQCGEGVELLSGTAELRVSCVVTGQPPGAAIFYRIVAVNAAGRAEGEVLSTTTVPGARGSPPVVTAVEFPPVIPIAGGVRADGTVRFADPDGDAAHVFFEEISDPADAFGGGADFALDLVGVQAGSFTFNLSCGAAASCKPGTITLGVVLEDAVGNRSAPAEFTWTQE